MIDQFGGGNKSIKVNLTQGGTENLDPKPRLDITLSHTWFQLDEKDIPQFEEK